MPGAIFLLRRGCGRCLPGDRDSLSDPAKYGRAWNGAAPAGIGAGARAGAELESPARTRARGSRHARCPGASTVSIWTRARSATGSDGVPGGRSRTASRQLTLVWHAGRDCSSVIVGVARRPSATRLQPLAREKEVGRSAGTGRLGWTTLSAPRRGGAEAARDRPRPVEGRDRELPAARRGRDRGPAGDPAASLLASTGSTTRCGGVRLPRLDWSPRTRRGLVELVEGAAELALGLFRTRTSSDPTSSKSPAQRPRRDAHRCRLGPSSAPPGLGLRCRARAVCGAPGLGRSWRSVQRDLPGERGRGRRPCLELRRHRDAEGNAHRTRVGRSRRTASSELQARSGAAGRSWA